MPDRRELFAAVAGLGVGGAIFQRALTAAAADDAEKPKPQGITAAMVEQAEWVAGVTLTAEERQRVARALTGQLAGLKSLRAVELPYDIPPAVQFYPAPGLSPHTGPMPKVEPPQREVKKPATEVDLAFAPLAVQSQLLRTREISSVELTELYLKRLKQFDPVLNCVVRFTDDLAMRQAEAADKELRDGLCRGPLHGIPWAAKDLIAYPGYPTTWGAEHFKNQSFTTKAHVAKKLDAAGAVLLAKVSLGSLALGDVWHGGTTKNPWNPKQGSSGSSAGSASAVAAGLVGFAIGSETLGSIVSPSTRCGATGLRPTFGRIGRSGCMALSWSMDKLGPLGRSVDDVAYVFAAIHGADPYDPTSVDRPFAWPGTKPIKEFRVGVFESTPAAVKKVLADLGVKQVPIKLPGEGLPVGTLASVILDAECAAAFDDVTRAGVRDGLGAFWPTIFRAYRFVSAVDYLRANRVRTVLQQLMAELFTTVDAYVGGNDLAVTNLTGHPSVCVPNGFSDRNGTKTPTGLTFTGPLFGETDLLTLANAYQQATGFHTERPPLG